MRILFHAPGIAAFRPDVPIHPLLGVQPEVAQSLAALKATHQLTGNRGNIIHAEAPARIFSKQPTKSAYGNIARLKSVLGGAYADTLADHFDMIIISLANFIRPTYDGESLASAIEALDGKVPFIVLGAGLQGDNQLAALPDGTQTLLALLNERATIFGVRGEETANWLEKNSLKNSKILGCPSLYVFPESILSIDGTAARMKGRNVSIMTAGHISMHNGKIVPRGRQLLQAFEGLRASYVFQDEIFAYQSVSQRGFSYNEGTNEANATWLNRWLEKQTGLQVNFERYYYFSEAGIWRQASLRHDVFIGDRFHGGVAALQSGTPGIFLKHDNRVSELTAHFGLPALTISGFQEKGIKGTLEEFLSEETLTNMKKVYRQRFTEFKTLMEAYGLTVVPKLPDEDAQLSSSRDREPVREAGGLAGPKTQNASAKRQNRGLKRADDRKAPPETEVSKLPDGLTPSITRLENYVLRRIVPQGAQKLVVSFEPAAFGQGKANESRMGFAEAQLLEKGFAVLSVVCPKANWYRPADLASYFASEEFRAWTGGFSSILTFGSVMGGFAAFTFADLLGAEAAIALNPVSTLALDLVPWETRFEAGRKRNWKGDFRDSLDGLGKTKVVYALTVSPSALDERHLDRISALAGDRFRKIYIPGGAQDVVRASRNGMKLKQIIEICPEFVSVQPLSTQRTSGDGL